ncbi:MAG: alpha/beta fold hydrolase [Bacteroidales bacterium]|nr:alpha/beta fold hydrolase [Bacteroidales bacterium]
MKRLLLSAIVFLAALFTASARDYQVYGPQGGLDIKITLPDGFNKETDHCPMVILMHGIFSRKESQLITALAKGLSKEGIGTISFDFDGHGKSQGRIVDMTVEKEIADAMAILEYVQSLPYVSQIGFLGHSQGGVIASMAAGRLAAQGESIPLALALLAPGSIIKEACQAGIFFNARFNPEDPPESISVFGPRKLGREYMVSTQELDIFGTAACYRGPVCIIHGAKDGIVPLWCSEKFIEAYDGRAKLTVLDGANHTFIGKRKEAAAHVVPFFKAVFFGQ